MAIDVNKVRENYMQVREYLDTLIVGEAKAKDVLASALLCDKNSSILLMGKPGTAKSTISSTLAENFISKKISITSDLLPSDIISSILKKENLKLLQLEELNRASGKNQSALIELLGSHMITGDAEVVKFSDFYVIATENDSEISGIFDVPQAIYDRFDISIKMGNLTRDELEQVLFEYKQNPGKANFNLSEIIDETVSMVSEFPYDKENRRLFMDATEVLDTATYGNNSLFASSNVRGHQILMRLAALHAIVNGRKANIMPDDIADYVVNVYLHRINQAILKINNKDAIKEMQRLEGQVLSLKRNKQ